MKTSRILTGLGAFALAAASVSAQAQTRAADAGAVAVQPVKMSTATGSVVRSAKPAAQKSEVAGASWVVIALGLAAVIGGIVIIADDDNDRSPGA